MGLGLHEVPLPMGPFPVAPGFLLELLNMCSVQKTEQSLIATPSSHCKVPLPQRSSNEGESK